MKRTPRDSALRDAFVGMLMTVGPFFGVRYQPPRVEIPVVMTPAGDDLDPATAAHPYGDDAAAAGSATAPGSGSQPPASASVTGAPRKRA